MTREAGSEDEEPGLCTFAIPAKIPDHMYTLRNSNS